MESYRNIINTFIVYTGAVATYVSDYLNVANGIVTLFVGIATLVFTIFMVYKTILAIKEKKITINNLLK